MVYNVWRMCAHFAALNSGKKNFIAKNAVLKCNFSRPRASTLGVCRIFFRICLQIQMSGVCAFRFVECRKTVPSHQKEYLMVFVELFGPAVCAFVLICSNVAACSYPITYNAVSSSNSNSMHRTRIETLFTIQKQRNDKINRRAMDQHNIYLANNIYLYRLVSLWYWIPKSRR